jgi:hypothetical protein
LRDTIRVVRRAWLRATYRFEDRDFALWLEQSPPTVEPSPITVEAGPAARARATRGLEDALLRGRAGDRLEAANALEAAFSELPHVWPDREALAGFVRTIPSLRLPLRDRQRLLDGVREAAEELTRAKAVVAVDPGAAVPEAIARASASLRARRRLRVGAAVVLVLAILWGVVLLRGRSSPVLDPTAQSVERVPAPVDEGTPLERAVAFLLRELGRPERPTISCGEATDAAGQLAVAARSSGAASTLAAPDVDARTWIRLGDRLHNCRPLDVPLFTDAAEAAYLTGTALDPASWRGHGALALLAEQTERSEDACERFRAAIDACAADPACPKKTAELQRAGAARACQGPAEPLTPEAIREGTLRLRAGEAPRRFRGGQASEGDERFEIVDVMLADLVPELQGSEAIVAVGIDLTTAAAPSETVIFLLVARRGGELATLARLDGFARCVRNVSEAALEGVTLVVKGLDWGPDEPCSDPGGRHVSRYAVRGPASQGDAAEEFAGSFELLERRRLPLDDSPGEPHPDHDDEP